MNIHLGSRERASIMVMCIFCTLIIVSGLIVCRYLQKWAKRIDTGQPCPIPGYNSNDVTIPNPSNPNITGGRIEDYHRNYMQYVPSFASLVKAWDLTQDRKRILRGRPLPGSLKPVPKERKKRTQAPDFKESLSPSDPYPLPQPSDPDQKG